MADNIDTCSICGKEIPPGPDFCSTECELKAALIALLATDAHSTKCAFAGCNCGMIEKYKLARAEAVALLRKV